MYHRLSQSGNIYHYLKCVDPNCAGALTYHEHTDEILRKVDHNKIHSENDKIIFTNLIKIERDVKTMAENPEYTAKGPAQILKSVLNPYGVIWVPTNLQKSAVNWVNNIRRNKKQEQDQSLNDEVTINIEVRRHNGTSLIKTYSLN